MCWPCKSWYRLTSDQSGDLETDDLTWPRSTSALLYYHRSPSPIRSGHAKTVHRWPVNTGIVSVYIILRGTEVESPMWWWTIIFLDHSEQMLVCSVLTLKSPGAKLVYILWVVLCCVRNSSYWPSICVHDHYLAQLRKFTSHKLEMYQLSSSPTGVYHFNVELWTQH